MLRVIVLVICALLTNAAYSQQAYPAWIRLSNVTLAEVGAHAGDANYGNTYIRLAEGFGSLSCSNGVAYLTTNKPEFKAIYGVLLIARSTEKKLARVDVQQESPNGACTIWLVSL